MVTKIIGILNVTPDSFFDGNEKQSVSQLTAKAVAMAQAGATFIDIGGESTRPQSKDVSIEEELNRVIPVFKELKKYPKIKLSIDTTKPEVAREALKLGASMVNDVSGLQNEKMRTIVAAYQTPCILMHSFGPIRPMTFDPSKDMLFEVLSFFKKRTKECIASGIKKENIILDPGIGFGKTLEQNLDLLRNLDQLTSLGFPLCIGHSRKSFIGKLLGSQSNPLPPEDRLEGTLAISIYCASKGVDYLRVHDVKETARALKVFSIFNE